MRGSESGFVLHELFAHESARIFTKGGGSGFVSSGRSSGFERSPLTPAFSPRGSGRQVLGGFGGFVSSGRFFLVLVVGAGAAGVLEVAEFLQGAGEGAVEAGLVALEAEEGVVPVVARRAVVGEEGRGRGGGQGGGLGSSFLVARLAQ